MYMYMKFVHKSDCFYVTCNDKDIFMWYSKLCGSVFHDLHVSHVCEVGAQIIS